MTGVTLNCPITHSNYLFEHPRCPNQSLTNRIANVAFHILTFGIPLAFYKIYSCCSRMFSRIVTQRENTNLQNIAIESLRQQRTAHSYSPIEKQALEFALQKLDEHRNISPTKFCAGYYTAEQTHQPTNPAIGFLTSLGRDVFFKGFRDALQENKEDPWNNPRVQNAADACLKIAYAISVLTLEDIRPFVENLAQQGETRNAAQALTKKDSYQYRTFFYCTDVYHMMRGGVFMGIDPFSSSNKEDLCYPDTISKSHADLFYLEGTLQNTWNILYNDYCDRIRFYVDENSLWTADRRFVNWTRKDTTETVFCSRPDPQPS